MSRYAVWGTLAALAWLAANGSVPLSAVPPSAAAQPKAITAGQGAFDRVCKQCHGPEGRGGDAPRLVPFSREYEELLAVVREGKGEMPPISARSLPDEAVAQIVVYLKSLS